MEKFFKNQISKSSLKKINGGDQTTNFNPGEVSADPPPPIGGGGLLTSGNGMATPPPQLLP